MSKTNGHTKTPWKLTPIKNSYVLGNDGTFVLQCYSKNAYHDAALIVRAVNEYDALNAVAEAAKKLRSVLRAGGHVSLCPCDACEVKMALAKLAQLKGKQPCADISKGSITSEQEENQLKITEDFYRQPSA